MSLKINQLFNIPNEIITSIITEWLCMKELCIFDTSINNKDFRFKLLNLMQSNHSLFNGKDGNSTNIKFLTWISLREISIRKLIINQSIISTLNNTDMLENILRNSPRLEILQFWIMEYSNHCLIDDNIIDKISECCKDLMEIRLYAAFKITDKGIISISNKLLGLKKLNLRVCYNITDTSIINISKNLTNLLDLDISGCNGITDAGSIKIAEKLLG
jgi:hypothetical protein